LTSTSLVFCMICCNISVRCWMSFPLYYPYVFGKSQTNPIFIELIIKQAATITPLRVVFTLDWLIFRNVFDLFLLKANQTRRTIAAMLCPLSYLFLFSHLPPCFSTCSIHTPLHIVENFQLAYPWTDVTYSVDSVVKLYHRTID